LEQCVEEGLLHHARVTLVDVEMHVRMCGDRTCRVARKGDGELKTML
jgi:hypothetical protein